MTQSFRTGKKNRKRSLNLLNEESSFGYIEAYNALRTNVRYLLPNTGKGSVVMITSSTPREGKSNVSINLSYSFAQDGKKVLLMDCDLRKGTLHKYLNVSSLSKGLTSVLMGRSKISDSVVHLEYGFDFLPVGTLPNKPSEMAGSQGMVDLLTYLQEKYDYIIMDSAPVNAVADTTIVARYVDGVILVVAQNETTRNNAIASKVALENASANILGVILNKYDSKEAGGSDYEYYSYYNYSDYGNEDSEEY